MKAVNYYPYLVGILVVLSSCEQEETPSYINIDEVNFIVNKPDSQGAATHNITDAWVYVGPEFVGPFETPSTFPVLQSGAKTIKVYAGIKNDGISASRITYPFYQFYTLDTTLVNEKVTTISPVVQYKEETQFAWIQDFETHIIGIDSAAPSHTQLEKTTVVNEVLTGFGSGKITLKDSIKIYRGVTTNKFTLPKLGVPVFLELDYKSTTKLLISLMANTPANGDVEKPSVIINPSSPYVWNKIYIDLRDEVSDDLSATTYQLVFTADITNVATEGEVLIDNIKLVHFEE